MSDLKVRLCRPSSNNDRLGKTKVSLVPHFYRSVIKHANGTSPVNKVLLGKLFIDEATFDSQRITIGCSMNTHHSSNHRSTFQRNDCSRPWPLYWHSFTFQTTMRERKQLPVTCTSDQQRFLAESRGSSGTTPPVMMKPPPGDADDFSEYAIEHLLQDFLFALDFPYIGW